MRKFAVFDIDGTLIRWQLYHALINTLIKKGYVGKSVAPEVHESRMTWKNRNYPEAFKDYELHLVELYDKHLSSIKVEHFNEVVDEIFDEYKDQVYVYTRDLIKDLKEKNYLLFAISGSQTEIVKKIAKHYDFDDFIGTTFHQEKGKFTGKKTHYLGRKDAALNELIRKHDTNLEGSVAVGDSFSDKQMLDIVQRPIAFNPERRLFDYAKLKGWEIVVERKNMVYELRKQDGKYTLAETEQG